MTQPPPSSSGGAPTADPGPLAGYTVGITAARRREEFGAALERRGAAVAYGPAIRIVPVADDSTCEALTRQCLQLKPDIVVATTGIGFRSWIEAADGWGVADDLLAVLQSAALYARGPKARGAMRAAGLKGEWSPESESINEVVQRLLDSDLAGKRIVLQEHGEPLPDVIAALRTAGAEVVEIPVYRWVRPVDETPLQRLCRQVADGALDAITFTSAPAAVSFLEVCAELGLTEEATARMSDRVLPFAVGPVTAGPLERAGIATLQPDRARLGSMVRDIAERLPARLTTMAVAGDHALEIRSRTVLVDGDLIPLSPTGTAILRMLADPPGVVVSRDRLHQALATGGEHHAVETAIGRLRAALPDPAIVQTVVKRGYRLAPSA